MSLSDPVLIDLALQGGGSHGAFTWGVLDRLLEESWLRIAGISGTSAGAMNAAALADGWTKEGAEGARAALDQFWQRVSRAAASSPLQRSPLDRLMGRWSLDTSPAYLAMDLMTRIFSPYDLNMPGFNPLRGILAECIDFDRLARCPQRRAARRAKSPTWMRQIDEGVIPPDRLLPASMQNSVTDQHSHRFPSTAGRQQHYSSAVGCGCAGSVCMREHREPVDNHIAQKINSLRALTSV
jgi:Patatin-like phospholipase